MNGFTRRMADERNHQHGVQPPQPATAPYIASLNLSASDRDSLLPRGVHPSLPAKRPTDLRRPDLAPEVEGIVYATVDRATVVHEQTGYDTDPFEIPVDGKQP